MGQSITVQSKQIEDICVFTTDRVLTGQDGFAYGSAEEAASEAGFGAQLAARLFGSDNAIDHVYVASSEVIVRRREGWDSDAIAAAAQIVTDLHRFYE